MVQDFIHQQYFLIFAPNVGFPYFLGPLELAIAGQASGSLGYSASTSKLGFRVQGLGCRVQGLGCRV